MADLRGSDTAVLVVGATGFVGSHLLPHLAASGRPTFATVRSGAAAVAVAGVRWVSGDLTAPDPTAAWPARCDTVIYLAQSRAWRQFPSGASDVFDVNVAGVFRAAEYARRAGARRFLLASTGSVHGSTTTPLKDDAPIHFGERRRFYVAAKIAAEVLLGAYAELMPIVVVRLFVPYGPAQSPEMLIPQLIRKVRTGEPIVLDGRDGLRLNPTAIGDVVEAFERSCRLDRSATFNVAGPEVLSLREIGERIGALVGRAPRFEQAGGPECALVGDTSTMSAVLGWAPQTAFIDGLQPWLSPSGVHE